MGKTLHEHWAESEREKQLDTLEDVLMQYCDAVTKRRAKDGYPPLWDNGTIQNAMYARAGWCCEHCGMAFERGTTKAVTARNRDGKPVILTVHHLDGDKSNCHWTNLLACCQRCHLHIQGTWQPGGMIPATWYGVPEWITVRGLAYQVPARQLALFATDTAPGAGGAR